jgi:hypothetical protein
MRASGYPVFRALTSLNGQPHAHAKTMAHHHGVRVPHAAVVR